MSFVKTKKRFGIFMLLFLGMFFVSSRNTNNVIAAPTASTTDLTPVADEFAYIAIL
ncbi:MAG: hypothetical protein IPH82_29485 [Chloroflexi bacterium]|nr:hypothetical protein [Chloroflexota bacterium]